MKYLRRHFRFGDLCIALTAAAAMASPLHAVAQDFAAAAAAATPGSSSETAQEQANKQVVLGFYMAIRQQNMQAAVEKYMSPDYKQNNERFRRTPGPGTDRDRLMQGNQGAPRQPSQAPAGPRLGPDTVVSIMARGDLVMMLTSRELLNPVTPRATPVYIFNMFRVKDGKLTEHWDVLPGELDTPQPAAASAGSPPARAP